MNTTRTMTVAAAVLAFVAQWGFAAPQVSIGDFQTRESGPWDDARVWEEWAGTGWVDTANVPGSKSLATVLGTHTVTITSLNSVSVRTLVLKEDVTAPAVVKISSAADLKILYALVMENDGSGPVTTINLAATAGSPGATLLAKSNITIAGTIDATGAGVNSIASDTPGDVVTVSSTGLLGASGGDLTVTSADVVMNGTVNAKPSRTVTFSGGINSGSSGNWELTDAGSVIRINTTNLVNIVSSAGHILITAGTFDIDQSFTFAGGLKQSGGTIDVAIGKTFKATGRYID